MRSCFLPYFAVFVLDICFAGYYSFACYFLLFLKVVLCLALPCKNSRIAVVQNANGNSNSIQISQFLAYNTAGQNVARQAATSSSGSYYSYSTPDKAVNGNAYARNGTISDPSFIGSGGTDSFWLVDFGSDQDISSIVIYNVNGNNNVYYTITLYESSSFSNFYSTDSDTPVCTWTTGSDFISSTHREVFTSYLTGG